jgi:hypothetical protein
MPDISSRERDATTARTKQHWRSKRGVALARNAETMIRALDELIRKLVVHLTTWAGSCRIIESNLEQLQHSFRRICPFSGSTKQ